MKLVEFVLVMSVKPGLGCWVCVLVVMVGGCELEFFEGINNVVSDDVEVCMGWCGTLLDASEVLVDTLIQASERSRESLPL